MLIPNEEIRDWKDLQSKVADLFREMGYDVHSPHVVQHVRGSKEIDVYVRDPRTSVPHIILIECKHWGTNLPQETVHGFRTVMGDCGANTGIIVGTTGFQPGATKAEAFTNVELRTWDALQRAYGNEWFLRQRERLTPLLSALGQKDRDYLSQGEMPKTLMNLMRFEYTGRLTDLYALLKEGRMLSLAMMAGPLSYDQPGPIHTYVDEDHPRAVKDRNGRPVLQHQNVRSWFKWIEHTATSLLERIEALEAEAFGAFEALDHQMSDTAFKEMMRRIREETPIYVLRPLIGEKHYQQLLALLAGATPSSGPVVSS